MVIEVMNKATVEKKYSIFQKMKRTFGKGNAMLLIGKDLTKHKGTMRNSRMRRLKDDNTSL